MKRLIPITVMCVALTLCLAGCASETQRLSDDIGKLGEITLDSGDSISSLNNRYEALSEDKKSEVGNYGVLQDANRRYDELILEKECTEAVAFGLQDGWGAMSGSWSSFADQGEALTICANAELAAISSYEADMFSDRDYASLIERYKAALQDEVVGLAGYYDDPATYNSMFVDAGQPSRKECLRDFIGSYGLVVEELYSDVLKSELEAEYGHLVSCGEPVLVSTDKGDVEIVVEGLAADGHDLSSLKSHGLLSESQAIAYLLCTVNNISRPAGDDYGEYMRLDELATVEDSNGNTLSAFDASYEYPGYAGIGAGVFGVYADSDVQVGEKKRCSIPFIIEEEAGRVCVNFATGDMLIASL